MPRSISFDRFDFGLDLRKGQSTSDANRLRVLKNAHVTEGRTIRKRPGTTKVATLETGTVGLFSAKGKLNTFYGGTGAAVTHANTLFQANRVQNDLTPANAVDSVSFADVFNGYIYASVKYANGQRRHHYLDDQSLTGWSAGVSYTVGSFIRPSTANGFRYEMTAGRNKGTVTVTIASPGVFTLASHGLVVNEQVRLETTGSLPTGLAVNTTYYVQSVPTAGTFQLSLTAGGAAINTSGTQSGVHTLKRWTGTTAGTEPTWPTTAGSTVVDNAGNLEITWTCRATSVLDANCPHTEPVSKIASKIWAVGTDGDVVRFSKTNDPRNWTTADDAGFLPVGLQQSGSSTATALGFYGSKMVVFFPDSSQIWAVDVDPAKHAFEQSVDVGATLPYSHANMSGDVFFLSPAGVRTITRQDVTTNLIDADVGSPIDSELLKGSFISLTTARAQYYRGGGQYWLYAGNKALVFTFSRTSGVSAWSLYEFPYTLDYMDELNAELYIRSGNDVYKVDRTAKTDDGTLYNVEIELAYLDFKMPGMLKQIHGMDAVVTGECDIAHRFDPRTVSLITSPAVTISGDSRPGYLYPVELMTTNIAPVITNYDNQDFELHQLTYYFDQIAPL